MISYAQNLEDVVLNRLFQDKPSGFYIDIGAHDPTELSVTRHFYDLGWRGINIEPIPGSFENIKEQRPRDTNLNLAVGAQHDILPIYELVGRPDLSTLNQEIASAAGKQIDVEVRTQSVEVRTLAEICEEHCDELIDFVKIDVEGGERDVIAGADWKRFRPTMLVVEAIAPCKAIISDWKDPDQNGTWDEWETLVFEADYILVYYDGLNRYYLRKEDEHLKNRFYIPITPLQDSYSLHSDLRITWEAQKQVDALKNDKSGLIGKVEGLDAEKSQLQKEQAGLTKTVQALESEKTGLIEKVEGLDSEKSQLQKEQAGLAQTIQALESKKAGLIEKVQVFEAEKAQLQKEQAGLAQTIQALESDKAGLNEKVQVFEDEKTQLQKEQAGLTKTVQALESDKSGLIEKVQVFEAEKAQLQKEQAGLTKTIQALEGDKVGLVEKVEGLEDEKTQLQKEQAGLAQTNQELESERAGLIEKVQVFEAEKAQLQEEQAGLTKTVQALESEKSGLQEERQSHEEKVQKLVNDVSDQEERIFKLVEENSGLFGQINELETEKKSLSQNLTDAQTESGRLSNLLEEEKKISGILHETQQKLSTTHKRIKQLEKQLGEANEVNGGLRESLEGLRRELEQQRRLNDIIKYTLENERDIPLLSRVIKKFLSSRSPKEFSAYASDGVAEKPIVKNEKVLPPLRTLKVERDEKIQMFSSNVAQEKIENNKLQKRKDIHAEASGQPVIRTNLLHPPQYVTLPGWEKVTEIVAHKAHKAKAEFIPSVEELLLKKVKPERQWVGVLHSPLRTTSEWEQSSAKYYASAQNLFKSPLFYEIRNSCRELVVFSEGQAEILQNIAQVPVVAVKHSLPEMDIQWSFKNFKNNDKKKIIQIGWWIQRMHALQMLPDSDYEKLWIQNFIPEAMEIYENEKKRLKQQFLYFDFMADSVNCLEKLTRPEYLKLLDGNLAFIHYCGDGVPGIILDCITTGTPIAVNAARSIVEYLGKDYPLYYYFYKDMVNKVHNFQLLDKANEYLLQIKRDFNFT